MTALRGLARLFAFLVPLLLALLGLLVLVLAVTRASVAPAFGLPAVREGVGSFFGAVEGGSKQAVAIGAGAGGMLVGLLLLVGLLTPRRERLVIAGDDEGGRIAARRRALADIADALAGRARGVTGAKAKVKARRRGRGGRLTVVASHPRTTPNDEASESVRGAVDPLARDFGLKARVRPRLGEGGERVQ